MATSGYSSFNLDLSEIIEEAYEACGLEFRSGYDAKTARRSINLLLLEWANKGVNLWTLEETEVPVLAGTRAYTLASDTLDILDAALVDSAGQEYPMDRLSFEDYIQEKGLVTDQRPFRFTVQRGATATTLLLDPVPDAAYTFRCWRMRYMQSAGVYSNNLDLPRRFLPAFCAGLAYQIAKKNPAKLGRDPQGQVLPIQGVTTQDRLALKAEYDALFQEAAEEDRDRASLFLRPRIP